MPSFLGRRKMRAGEGFGGPEPRKYIDLNEFDTGVDISATGPMVRVAEIYRYEDLRHLSDYVYNGDILILDYSSIANDDLTLRRIISELKSIAKDIVGDVAGIGKNYLMITPGGIKISRKKIRGPG